MGKTYLACALADAACHQGYTARYRHLPRLVEHLAIARADGRHIEFMTNLAKVDIPVLDD